MKFRSLISLVLVLLLIPIFTACDTPWDTVEDMIDDRFDAIENSIENKHRGTATLTQTEAEKIALDHAGLAENEVSGLHTEYDIDNGISKYEVHFYRGGTEYEYNINAETGEILSFEKD